MKILLFFFIFLICVSYVSSLTEEERIRNNELLQRMKEKGEILGEGENYKQDLNPFLLLGVLIIGIIILVYILIRIMNRDRL